MPMDSSFYVTMGTIALLAISILAWAALRGWHEWIEYKRAELEKQYRQPSDSMTLAVSRIEVADLKERVKRLEAIAAGIDL